MTPTPPEPAHDDAVAATGSPDRMPRVAYSGEPGAFAEDAVRAHFRDPEPVPLAGFRAVFEAVESDPSLAAGVLPVENLVNGTVREVYDLLLEHGLVIRGEIVVPVRLCLAALPGERLETIERVYSKMEALGQAETFLRTRPWTLLTAYNTAGAGKAIVDRGERGAAAVLSPRAAALFGLEILADSIESVSGNRTRFFVMTRTEAVLPDSWLQRAPVATSDARRTTLVLSVRNEPGALLRCLGVFASHGINMSKLESRPSRERPWEYVFWVDLDADVASSDTSRALIELSEVAQTVRILGSYARAPEG